VGSVVLLLAVVGFAGFVLVMVDRHRRGLVAERGTSIGSDLGALADQPRVRILTVTQEGPDRVRVVLIPDEHPVNSPRLATSADLDLVVSLNEDESGLALLREWKRSESWLAIVFPPDSHLVRLRSIDSLQPLTLRRVDR
jgi:hypothetical protein